MYEVNGVKFDSYMQAITAGKADNSEVFEKREDGASIRRWAPAAPVAAKKMRRYAEQKAAFEAQQRMNSKV